MFTLGNFIHKHMKVFLAECQALGDLENGHAVYSSNRVTVSFSCDDGYTLVGEATLICEGSKWNNGVPQCYKGWLVVLLAAKNFINVYTNACLEIKNQIATKQSP